MYHVWGCMFLFYVVYILISSLIDLLAKIRKLIVGAVIAIAVIAAVVMFSGMGGQQAKKMAGGAQVKAMNVLVQDTPLELAYAGSVKGKDEVKVKA